jgi:hypothetical protein
MRAATRAPRSRGARGHGWATRSALATRLGLSVEGFDSLTPPSQRGHAQRTCHPVPMQQHCSSTSGRKPSGPADRLLHTPARQRECGPCGRLQAALCPEPRRTRGRTSLPSLPPSTTRWAAKPHERRPRGPRAITAGAAGVPPGLAGVPVPRRAGAEDGRHPFGTSGETRTQHIGLLCHTQAAGSLGSPPANTAQKHLRPDPPRPSPSPAGVPGQA